MAELVHVAAGGHVVALNAATGAERWRSKIGWAMQLPIHLVADEDRVYALGNQGLYALDPQTGAQLWHREPVVLTQLTRLALVDGDIVVTTNGEVFCFEPENGLQRWHAQLKGLGLGAVSIAKQQKKKKQKQQQEQA